MPQELRLSLGDGLVPFSVSVRNLTGAERELLVDLVSPYWLATAEKDRRDSVAIVLVRRRSVPGRLRGNSPEPSFEYEREVVTVTVGEDVKETVFAVIGVARAIVKVFLVESASGRNCHAGAVDHRGSGMLFTGARGSGKTTVLRACAAAGFGLVANDQCVLLPGVEPVAVGFPALVAIRPEAERARLRLPLRPLVIGVDKQDGIARRRYSLPDLAKANGTSCVGRTQVRLLVSYAQTPIAGVLEYERVDSAGWLDAASYDLLDAYGPRLVDLASGVLRAYRVDVRGSGESLVLRHVPHYRVTCSEDMLDRLPGTLAELVGA
ncbi:hypothetical protein AB0H12_03640 [Actinosynnema sp. NPDC023794]